MSSESAEQTIGRLVRALVDAWNVHDARAFAEAFAVDADFTNVFGMHASGRDAIEQFHAPIFQTMFKDSRLEATETRIRMIRPDIAPVDAAAPRLDDIGPPRPRRINHENFVKRAAKADQARRQRQ